MEFSLPTAIAAALVGTSVLSGTLFYLRTLPDAPAGLGLWGLAFALNALRHLAFFVGPGLPRWLAVFASEFLQVAAVLVLLAGVLVFTGRRARWGLLAFVGFACAAWIAWTIAQGVGFFARALPLYTLSGGMMLVSAGLLLPVFTAARVPLHSGYFITAASLALWGIHKMDFPWLRTVAWFAPWGFLLAQVLALAVALGLIIISTRALAVHLAAELRTGTKSAHALSESNERLRLALRVAGLFFWDWNIDRNETVWDRDPAPLLGHSAKSGVYPDINDMLHPDDRQRVLGAWEQTIRENAPYDIQFRILDGQGGVRWVEAAGRLVRSDDGKPIRVIGVSRDITEQTDARREIEYLAHHDPLTGLPNRLLYNDRLSQELARAHRSDGKIAVLFMDLDGFKDVNDTLGHNIGDALLKQAAQRMAAVVRRNDTVARHGGDEFVVITGQSGSTDDVERLADRLLDVFRQSFMIDQHILKLSISIGIALFPEDGSDSEILIKNADIAMYRAKERGRNVREYYSPELGCRVEDRVSLEKSLHEAIGTRELSVHYQPIASPQSGRLVGAEALLRWRHPTLGDMPPAHSIPVAEKTSLIVELGEWVLDQALRDSKDWRDEGIFGNCYVAVNVSTRQFQRTDMLEQVTRVLRDGGHDARMLELEITESLLLEPIAAVQSTLENLDSLGVRLSLDDFGTGYSSLAYLGHLPIRKLKVDRAFVETLPGDADNAHIVRTVVALTKNFELRLCAEGIENPAQAEFLCALGCDEFQGYLISRPLPKAEFEEFLRQNDVATDGLCR